MCSISSTTTERITSLASSLPSGCIEYSAHRYGGIVESSSVTAACSSSFKRATLMRVSSSTMRSAVRRVSAAIVSVGFEVPIVGKLPEPTRKRLRCSHERWSASTTESSALAPITCVPAKCPMPW